MLKPLLATFFGITFTFPLFAQTPPKGPVKFIVPQAAGGTTDTIARAIADRLTQQTGVAIVVDNKPGAGGNLGTEIAAKAIPDGNTLVVATSGTHTINPYIYSSLPYDPIKDFVPIVVAGYTTNVTAVHPSVPVKTLSELVTYARQNPGKLNYGSAGVGSSPHLAGALFNSYAAVDIVHVPYKGSTPSVTALLSGEVQVLHSGLVGLHQHAKAGKVRLLSVNGNKRSAVVPELATAVEQGVKDFDVSFWIGLMAPAGTPAPVVAWFNQEVNKALQSAEVQGRLSSQGVEIAGGSAESFSALIRRGLDTWRETVRAARIKPD